MKFSSSTKNNIGMLSIALILLAFSILSLFFKKHSKLKKILNQSGGDKNENFSVSPNDKFHLFHATWCGHCVNFAPIFSEFKATNLIETSEHEDSSTPDNLKKKFDVKGYPTMAYENTKGENKLYTGPRTIKGITSFIESERSKST